MKTTWSVTESVAAFREMIAGKARWDEQMRNNNIVRNMQVTH